MHFGLVSGQEKPRLVVLLKYANLLCYFFFHFFSVSGESFSLDGRPFLTSVFESLDPSENDYLVIHVTERSRKLVKGC